MGDLPLGVESRRATVEDLPAILELLRRGLGWSGDVADARFFLWRHHENPFGPSPMWVATAGDRVVALRAFLRWRLVPPYGLPVAAARAVETVTDPDFRRQGISKRLLLEALEHLRAESVSQVFALANAATLPLYATTGWQVVGRLPIAVRPLHPGRMIGALAGSPATPRASEPATVGVPAGEPLADGDAVQRLLDSRSAPWGLATRWTAEPLRWRYGFEPLRNRVVTLGSSVEDGMAILRVQRRGLAREVRIEELLVPGGSARAARALVRAVAAAHAGDYVSRVSPDWAGRDGFVRAPRRGPVLVSRNLHGSPAHRPEQWSLTLGDVDGF